MQTGASALFVASSVVALFGLVHAFDLVRRKPAVAVEPQHIAFQPEAEIDLPAGQDADTPMAMAADLQLATDNGVEKSQPVGAAAPRAKAGRLAKAPRKGGGRRVTAPKTAKITDPEPAEEADATEPASLQEAEAAEPAPLEEVEAVAEHFDEAAHISHAPLFDPDRYARPQRPVFGRKAG
ncbi:MAG: hypothetical protein ACREB1_03085 [Sphingomicrobium sp.]